MSLSGLSRHQWRGRWGVGEWFEPKKGCLTPTCCHHSPLHASPQRRQRGFNSCWARGCGRSQWCWSDAARVFEKSGDRRHGGFSGWLSPWHSRSACGHATAVSQLWGKVISFLPAAVLHPAAFSFFFSAPGFFLTHRAWWYWLIQSAEKITQELRKCSIFTQRTDYVLSSPHQWMVSDSNHALEWCVSWCWKLPLS